jgi:hypothetical protein
MKLSTSAVIAAVWLTALPAAAQAQSEFFQSNLKRLVERVGVHASMSVREPVDSDVSKGGAFGLSVGFSPGGTTGWRYPISLSTFSETLHGPNGEPFADIRTTAVIGGIGYSWRHGKLHTSAALQAGFAVNRHSRGDTVRAFGFPSDAVAIEVGNAPLLRPQLKTEYFLTPKLSVGASLSYIMMRPAITVVTPQERFVGRWNASNVYASVGVGFYPFRKMSNVSRARR